MNLNKKLIISFFCLLFNGCEDNINSNDNCLEGVEQSIEATSFTNWIYYSIKDTGFVEIDINESDAYNSTDWDIAMMRNHFRTNSGLSGISDAGVAMIDETWTCESFNSLDYIPNNLIFTTDSLLSNIYQPWAHDDEDTAYTEAPGNTLLENWGWFDIDNDYYFYYSHKKFIVKLPENRGYIKIWPYQYYGELGQSAHISLVYDFIVQE